MALLTFNFFHLTTVHLTTVQVSSQLFKTSASLMHLYQLSTLLALVRRRSFSAGITYVNEVTATVTSNQNSSEPAC